MKTTLLTLAISLIINTFLFSQTERGSWILNGNALIARDLRPENKSTAFTINPRVAYALTDRLFLGVNAVYSYTSSVDLTLSSVRISPIVRYYFPIESKRWSWFAMGGYTYNKFNFDFNQIESSENTHSFFGGIGHDYFLNSNIAIEGILQFRYDKYESNDTRNLFYEAGLQFFLPATRREDTSGVAIAKGTQLIDLEIYGGWLDTGDFNDLYFSVNPTIGLFVNNRLVLGGGVLLAFASDNTILELQPLARYYFGTQNARFQPFAMANLNTRFQFADKSSEANFFNLDVNAGIGADFFLTRNVALEGILQFNGNQIEDEVFNRNYLNFNIGLQFFLNE